LRRIKVTLAKKRAAHEGSIYQRKSDKRWVGVIDLGCENGKRKRKPFYGETQGDVREKLRRALSDHSQNIPIAPERQLLGDFLKHWLEESVKRTVRALTFEQYAQHVRLYIEPCLGRIYLSKPSAQNVERFINELLDRGLNPRTVQITLFVIRRALSQALKRGLAARNVADLVDCPRAEKKEIRPPTIEQAQSLLEAVIGVRMEAVFTVGLALGLRRGELLGLRWQDVDFEAGTISVKQALQRNGGKLNDGQKSKLRFVAPKTSHGNRTIPMPDCVGAALRSHRARQAAERLAAGPDWQDFGLVFTSRKGTPVEPRRLDHEFKGALKRAGLPDTIRVHDARHFAASLLLAQGVNPRTVMEILGHSDISTTLNIYSHVFPEVMRQAANKIDAVFSGR
jgi:integrase